MCDLANTCKNILMIPPDSDQDYTAVHLLIGQSRLHRADPADMPLARMGPRRETQVPHRAAERKPVIERGPQARRSILVSEVS